MFYVICKVVLVIGLWGMVFIGYLQGLLVWWECLVVFVVGVSLVLVLLISDELGFVFGVLVIGWYFWCQCVCEVVV